MKSEVLERTGAVLTMRWDAPIDPPSEEGELVAAAQRDRHVYVNFYPGKTFPSEQPDRIGTILGPVIRDAVLRAPKASSS